MGDTPRCADCGTVYCMYRDEIHEWVCNECMTDREHVSGRWPY